MLDLVNQPNFNSMVPTVVGQDFARRFGELSQWVNKEIDLEFAKRQQESKKTVNRNGIGRTISSRLMNEYKAGNQGEYWIAATLGDKEQALLNTQTRLIRLSAETVIKMIAHHPEQAGIELFRETALLLKNAIDIQVENEQFAIYYAVREVKYKASVKATKDKKELYLTTLFKIESKNSK